jgi:hypothetical protein
MMADALIQQVSKMKISKKNKKLFDKKLKAIRPEWEGLDSENAKNQLKANGALRKPFVELMDKAEFQNLGFPDVASQGLRSQIQNILICRWRLEA